MITKVRATFDGEVFRPKVPVDLEPDTQVQLTVETNPEPDSAAYRTTELQALLRRAGSVSSGDAASGDNYGIDRDLANEPGSFPSA